MNAFVVLFDYVSRGSHDLSCSADGHISAFEQLHGRHSMRMSRTLWFGMAHFHSTVPRYIPTCLSCFAGTH